jgi:glutamate---cysteine ligase / carboxylate-amine ligase
VFQAVPRTGLPEKFSSWGEYRRHVNVLVNAGIIEDATKIWWDVRPSERYPTLEMRVTDICTRLDDAMTVAAIYVSLLSLLFRMRADNTRWRSYANMLIAENKWRAQRYGVTGSLMDYGRGELVPYPELVEEIIEHLGPHAEHLGCVDELENARDIVARGTSADRQLATYQRALSEGASEREALVAVVDFLIAETVSGL